MAFWKQWSKKWYQTTVCYSSERPQDKIPVQKKCKLKKNYTSVIHTNYESAKATAKKLYFRNATRDEEAKRISKYKRAAVLTYAVMKSEPLIYINGNNENLAMVDPYYLKERLAVYMAIGSIIQDFPQDKVSLLLRDNTGLYDFESLGMDRTQGDDTFLESMYKDLFLADLYGNYNVLTMANVYGLLTERCSELFRLIADAEGTE